MIDYDLLNRIVRRHKSALTRAKNSGDPIKVITACRAARIEFDQNMYPDNWPLWTCALADLQTRDTPRKVMTAARNEEDSWRFP